MNFFASSSTLDHFSLSDDSFIEIDAVLLNLPRWQAPSHLGRHRPALTLLAGETATLPAVAITPDSVLYVEFGPGLPKISPDGMTLDFFAALPDRDHYLGNVCLSNFDTSLARCVALDIGHLAPASAQIKVRAGPGPLGDPTADWASIIALVVGPAHDLELLKARAFRAIRSRNEIAHFNAVYDHIVYADRARKARGEEETSKSPEAPKNPDQPRRGENVYSYGMRLLGRRLRATPPNFEARLKLKSSGEPLRLASLCAGKAQIEAAIIRAVDSPVELLLVDINDKLLDQAVSFMPSNVKVRLLVQDVNALKLETDYYDVVMCVSGAHHVIELEKLWQGVRNGLRQDGELWLIGEQIGPNGNRLAPPDYAAANRAFQSIPKKFRLNAYSGQIDSTVPNADCSEATYEGIRSENIQPTLSRFFSPIDVYTRNCFLWRLLNQTYSDNYDLSSDDDVAVVRQLVAAEITHFMSGGTPTELHAAYRPLG
jgi:SAM-dependent methyltransferase